MCDGMHIPGAAALVFVLMVIFMIMLAFIMRPKGKSVLKWLGVYTVIVVGYIGFVCYTCGPNPKNVAVMKPMAEAISSYIVKNGIPKSLKDIEGLPYELEGCNKPQDNVEDCTFFVKDYRYSLELYEMGGGDLSIRIKNRATKTGVDIGLRRNNKESQWFFVEEKSFSSKTSGICNPMKQ